MSIANEITRINNNIANAYTAVSNKGGTLPATQNSANLATAIGTITGGGGQTEPFSATVYPGTQSYKLHEYAQTGHAFDEVNVTVNTAGGGYYDVEFYDYDGTLLYHYTKSQFLNLTEMPEVPDHRSVNLVVNDTAPWNWTLSDAKNHVETYGRLCIGAQYLACDNSGNPLVHTTMLYMYLNKSRNPRNNGTISLTFTGVQSYGGEDQELTIDWGDGSSTETVTIDTFDDATTFTTNPHTYQQDNRSYFIKITASNYNATYGFKGFNSTSVATDLFGVVCGSELDYFMSNSDSSSSSSIAVFYLKYFIPNVLVSKQLPHFTYTSLIKHITIPIGATKISTIYGSIETISIPYGVNEILLTTYLGNNTKLRYITLPETVLNITGGIALLHSSMPVLQNIIMPKHLQTLPRLFSSVSSVPYTLSYVDFSACEAIPTLPSRLQSASAATPWRIIVPDDLYAQWQTNYNWNPAANIIVKHSDYFGN